MTPEQKKKYIDSGGSKCPYCNSENISAVGCFNADVNSAWRKVACDDCGEVWNDVYRLIDAEEL